MASVYEIKDKLPILVKSKSSGLLVRIDSISPYDEGVGVVVGGGNGVSMAGYKVGDWSDTWSLSNFNVFKG